MDNNLSWFTEFNNSEAKNHLKNNPVVYFCAEYALTSSLPIYAGGLGVLAGDLLREASDRHFPIVAIGLYYNDGYETLHQVDQKGFIAAPHVHRSPEFYGLEEVMDADGKELRVQFTIGDREVSIRIWRWQVGTIPVFLLDTDCPENTAEDRKITDHLYVKDKETRLKQEIILGIGGAKFLEKINLKPSVYHMNEGHSSLLSFEIIRSYMKSEKMSFQDAIHAASEKIVFTNHTLVPGGLEIFSNELVSLLLSSYANELGVPMHEFLSLGKVEDANSFSMTQVALTVAGITNAVSKIHSKYALNLWPDNPLIPITNGIHIPTWDGINNEEIWLSHMENKRALIEKIYLLKNVRWQENDLIIGWARRIVEYKRPMAILENVQAIKTLCEDKNRPVKLIFSGTLHPSDIEGAQVLEKFYQIIDHELAGSAIFIPEYNLDTARLLTAGCDVWLNTPIIGFEACGTSGMKASLNGVLPVSTRDGWIDETELLDKGWALDNDNINASILGILQNDVLPMYYERDEKGIPQNWQRNMKNSREVIKSQFSATRMLREYIEKLYIPIIKPASSKI